MNEAAENPMALHPKTVLVVEDNEIIRVLFRLQMSKFSRPLVIWEAKNGEEGFYKAKQLLPDIIITDLDMPVKDGLFLIKSIRSELTELKDVPIIVTTGTGAEPQMRCLEAGASFVMEKPLHRQTLFDVMMMLLDNK